MRIDIRAAKRMRTTRSANVTGVLGPLIEAVRDSDLDLSRLRVVCDWIQYRNNFRSVLDDRPILAAVPPQRTASGTEAADGAAEHSVPVEELGVEIAADVRRCSDADVATVTKQLLAERAQAGDAGHVLLEPWVAGRESCIWRFNALYWQALSLWERATGQGYEQALPGGESDARNREAARELILDLFRVWDDLSARGALPDELYVVELGVGNGNQAKTWLDEFVELDPAHGRDYYRRLHYLMGDYSAHVLAQAQQAVADHGDRVNALVLDATRPQVTLGFLRGKTFLVYISNVYDNLPTDEVARIDGHTYRVEVRAYLPETEAGEIARRFSMTSQQLPALTDKLLRLGPELISEAMPAHFGTVDDAVAFWQDVWGALRLQERYVPVSGLDLYRISPTLTGEALGPLLEAHGDIRMHVNNGALTSFAETLPLLHPFGRLLCHDLFVTDSREYRAGFYGPGKYDGSVVNWVNGRLLQHVGSRRGFDVRFTPFAQRPSSNVKTLTAQIRD